jgi:hypothetical protein
VKLWREMLFELPHENAGLHFHREAKQFEIELPFGLPKWAKQSVFQTIKGFIRVVADI